MSIETSPEETIAPSDVEYQDGMRDGVLLCASILANYRRETLEQTGATQITSFCEALELGLQQVADAIQSKLKSAAKEREVMSEPIREALHKAAKAVLSNLSDRKGIGNELEQCDEDIQTEIGITVAAKAIAAFLRALPINDARVPFYAFWHPLARVTEDAAKEEKS